MVKHPPIGTDTLVGDILRNYPTVTTEDIRACLAFAAGRERKLVKVPA